MPVDGKLVVVIDDDSSVRKAIDRQVAAAGYRTRAFASAEDFLGVAISCGAACVVSDIQLGGLSGLDLALHPIVASLDLPVILISGTGDPVIEEPAQLIAAAFLRKPIPPGKLLEAIVAAAGPPLAQVDD